jgi:hypothetical protein
MVAPAKRRLTFSNCAAVVGCSIQKLPKLVGGRVKKAFSA